LKKLNWIKPFNNLKKNIALILLSTLLFTGFAQEKNLWVGANYFMESNNFFLKKMKKFGNGYIGEVDHDYSFGIQASYILVKKFLSLRVSPMHPMPIPLPTLIIKTLLESKALL